MKYFYSVTDKNNFVHSIDNLVVTYDIKSLGQKGIDNCIDYLHELSSKHDNQSEYWERLNVNACVKYQFYNNHIHLRNGIYISVGKYVEFVELSRSKERYIFPVIKLEINPNKNFDKPIFQDLLKWLSEYTDGCTLSKYDYAIDIPLVPDDVQVFGTRKERGLYHGTRYYGQRNKNGYCKIYDKQKEQDLDSPLTRIEHTITLNKTTKNISFENIYFKSNKADTDIKLNSTYTVLFQTLICLRNNNIPIDDFLNGLDKRVKRIMLEALGNTSFEPLEFDKAILDELLDYTKSKFHFTIKEEKDGADFVEITDDEELPFD